MAYKMKGHSLPGPNQKSPLKQDYKEALEHHEKYKKTKAWKKSFDKWMKGVVKRGGTTKSVISKTVRGGAGKALGTIGLYLGSMKAAKATQPGTGEHGGKKVKKYNPKTGKYE